MGNERIFVRVVCALRTILGVMTLESFGKWVKDVKWALELQGPVVVAEGQTPDRKIVIETRPLHAQLSQQTKVWVVPEIIENLGEVVDNICVTEPKLWGMYRDALTVFAAQKANIVAPTAADMSKIIKMPHA